MQIGDKVRVKNAGSYFAYWEGIIISKEPEYDFPVGVDFPNWPKTVQFSTRELMVIP